MRDAPESMSVHPGAPAVRPANLRAIDLAATGRLRDAMLVVVVTPCRSTRMAYLQSVI